MYIPINDCVYAKAFEGCFAGLSAPKYLDPVAGNNSAYAQMADAYAQEFDTVWGAPAPTNVEEDLILSCSTAAWQTRGPLESAIAFTPGSYNGIVLGVIAQVQEGNAQVVAEGIDPNGCSGGPAPTPTPIQTTANFNMPAPGALPGVVVAVNNTAPLTVGDWVYLVGAGWMQVTVIGSLTSITLENLPGVIGNVATGTVVPSGTKVTPSGPGDARVQGLFDVRAFGATPTDLGPGVQAALFALQANNGGTVYIPPLALGLFWQWATPVSINFLGQGTHTSPATCRVEGAGTVIQITQADTGFLQLLFIANGAGDVFVRGLIFLGGNFAGVDTANVLQIGATNTFVEDCQCWGVLTNGGGTFLLGTGTVVVKNCFFAQCSETAANGGLIALASGIGKIDSCTFSDITSFGTPGIFPTRSGPNAWIAATACEEIEIVNCSLDETVHHNIALIPNAPGSMHRAAIRSCSFNMSNRIGGNTIDVDGSLGAIDSVVIENCQFALGFGGVNSVVAVNNCGELVFRRNTFAASDEHFITVGTNVGQIAFENNAGNVSVDTSTNAPSVLKYSDYGNPVRTLLGFTALFVDPANSTGFAADSNTGANSTNVPAGTGPILTTRHLNELLFFRKLTANTTVTYLSDDTSGTPLDYSTIDTAGFTLTFQGTSQLLHTGGTLDAGTLAINPAAPGGGQRQTAHTTDIADFTPFIWTGNGGTAAHPVYLNDTTGANIGTKSWLVKNVGATASLSWPVTTGQAQGSLTIGDGYTLLRGSILRLSAMGQPVGLGTVAFNNFAFDIASIGAPNSTYTRCSFEGVLQCGGFFIESYIGGGVSPASDVTNITIAVASVIVSVGGQNRYAGTFVIGDGDYITGDSLDLSVGVFSGAVIASGSFASSVQFQDMTRGGLIIGEDIIMNGILVWGNGNAGPGMTIRAASINVSATVGEIPTVTGAGGDFAFVAQNGGALVSVARAFDDSTGEYTEIGGVATRATTWANFANTIAGGGFGFQAHHPATGATIFGT